MGAKLNLINAALAHLGEPGFASLDLDPLPPKLTKVLAQLDGPAGVYEWVLARHPWLCALEYETLPAANRGGNWMFATVFDLPQGFVKLWTVEGCGPYEIGTATVGGQERKVLRTDSGGPVNIGYTKAKAHEAMSADVLAAMAFELAGRCAGPVAANAKLGLELRKEAGIKLREAMDGEAGQHGGSDPVAPSGFERLRRAGAF